LAQVDAYWLQRRISKAYGGAIDAPKAQALSEEVFDILQVGRRCCPWGCCRGGRGWGCAARLPRT
jgi:hypothetical protein